MIKFSDPIDQQRYDAGFKFMPQDRFLAVLLILNL